MPTCSSTIPATRGSPSTGTSPASSYPAWFRSNVETELEVNWDDPVANNSNVPHYDNGGDNTGGGTVTYTVGGGVALHRLDGLDRLQPGRRPARSFDIYVRSLPSPSAPTWMWYHRDNTCSDLYDGSP